ncbi:type II toxin-antitoxin system RelE/ParE family toxin [Bacillus sp. JJ722]|uniref:type II toxin-antitoxin system RelE/ParE family toxin n=1 Tax=Bacillus sp. JJ722 TaxID=3122973 RepID=UPI0030005B58
MNYEVIFYEDDRGRSPVKEFLNELDNSAKKNKQAKQLLAKIALYIEILESSGTRSGLPYTKHIGNGIWELRPKDHRIFFFGWDGNKIVLLHSFRKETQKTPQKEIDLAEIEMKDWLANGKKRLQSDL